MTRIRIKDKMINRKKDLLRMHAMLQSLHPERHIQEMVYIIKYSKLIRIYIEIGEDNSI